MTEFDNHIESALKKEINFRLPDNFSDKIVSLIVAREKRESKLEVVGIILAGLLFTGALGVTLYLTDFKFSLGALTFLSDHLSLVAFGILFIAALQLIDKKLIRKQQAS